MRITGWHVDGYGRFRDQGWSDLPPGLTVFHGPNEAGKSTLLSFLRSMLFGLKGRTHKDPAIPALGGGTHGGRLWLADAHDGVWTVQQHKPGGLRLEGPDGSVRDEAALAALLGNVGRDVFEAVFAFSLTELERLGGLDGDALRDQLFASTLTGGGSSAHAALDVLQGRIDGLYRQRTTSPLKDVDERLKTLRKERTAALAGAAAYAGLLADERLRTEEHQALRGRTAELRRELDRLERLDRLWTLVGPLRDARAARDDLAGIASVADDVVERANGIVERRGTLAERAAAVAARREDRAATPTPEPDPLLLAVADEVADRVAETVAQRDRLTQLPQLRAVADGIAAAARDAVADLGPGWDADRVAAIDASHPVRQAARELADAARRADEARGRAADEHRRAVALTDAASERVAEARTAFPDFGRGVGARGPLSNSEREGEARASLSAPAREAEARELSVLGRAADVRAPHSSRPSPGEPSPAAEIDAALAAIPDLRSAFQDRAARRRAVRTEDETLERLRSAAPRAASVSPASGGVRVSLLLLVGIAAAVVGVVLIVAGQPVGGVAVVIVGAVVAWVDRAGRGGDDLAARSAEAARDASDAHAAQVREQESRLAAERRLLAEADDRLADAARRSGIDPAILADAATTEPIERHAAGLEALRDERRAYDGASAELAAAVAHQRTAQGEQDHLAGELDAAVAEAERVDDAWRSQRDVLGLPDDVTPQRAPEFFEVLLRARTALQDAEAAEGRLAETTGACERWTAAVSDLLVRAGRARPSGPATAAVGAGAVASVPFDPADPRAPLSTGRVGANDVVQGDAATPTGASWHGAGGRGNAGPRDPASPNHIVTLDALAQLGRAVREGVALRAAAEDQARDDARDGEELRELEHRIASVDGELRELLADHGVADLDALGAARDATRRRAALGDRIVEAEAAIRREAGAGADGDALIAEAQAGDVTGWAARRTEVDAELPRLEDEYRAAVAAATQATDARRALESSVDLPRIDGEIEQARTDAARLMAEYRTLLRAQELIASTLDAFVRDQQPAVLRDASAWFQRITEGRYREVRQALAEGGGRSSGRSATLLVVPVSGEPLDPAVLSRGTREQLYLCLRLALARGTAARTGPLPLVMDDVLVNFSPDRVRAVADVVATVAREQQVLFFTCHPATRDLLVEAAERAGAGGTARIEELVR